MRKFKLYPPYGISVRCLNLLQNANLIDKNGFIDSVRLKHMLANGDCLSMYLGFGKMAEEELKQWIETPKAKQFFATNVCPTCGGTGKCD